MAVTVIKQKIDVCAIFKKNFVSIKWFEWKGRQIEVNKITHKWYTKDGQNKILHLAVTGDNGYYEISYNINTFEWILEKTEVE